MQDIFLLKGVKPYLIWLCEELMECLLTQIYREKMKSLNVCEGFVT